MARIVVLLGETATGFVDPVSGSRLVAATGNEIEDVLKAYHRIKDSDGTLSLKGGKEVKLTALHCLASRTAGGMMKSSVHFG